MADGEVRAKSSFHSMMEGTAEQWKAIGAASAPFRAEHPNRLMDHLRMLSDDSGGFAVTRLEHSLQTATRAHQAGHDEEYVVCALMHDIGDILCPSSHAEIGAAVMRPYVSEANHWMMEKHGVFQGYYFFHLVGLDRDMREQYRGHPHFEHTAQFCHLYDQNSFDPDFKSMPLEAFEPMLRRVVATPKNTIYRREPA